MTTIHIGAGPRKAEGMIDRRPQHGFDAVSVLTVYLVLLCAVPSELTITALGSAGRPSSLWALFAALWWAWSKLHQHTADPRVRRQPVRIAFFIFLGVALISYAWAMLRGLPVSEVSPADSALLALVGWGGIVLVACDGIDDAERFRTLMRRVALVGALMATLGLLQFITGQSLIDWISIPGTSTNTADLAALGSRAGFIRASGTAAHPLEYGVVLCIALPIAISLAFADHGRSRLLRWLPVVVILVASVLSVSRSELIGVVAGLLVLLPSWPRRIRFFASVGGLGIIVLLGIFVPGILGTIRGLFDGVVSGDSSTASRLGSYDAAAEFIGRFPIVGKGLGTFLPIYRILDNEYLLLTIELGFAGLVAFLTLLVVSIWSVSRARRFADNELDRGLGQALIASTVAGALLMAFFDGLSFSMSAGLLFLMLGMCGAYRRLHIDLGPPSRDIAQPSAIA
jgi:O-antigen ligase